jgi:cytoskeletal protein RodZ
MKSLSLVIAIGLGLAVSVGAQQYGQQQQQQQQPTEDQQQGMTSKGQTTDQPAGPSTGHSKREQMKDTSQPAKMKSGGTATTNTSTGKSQTNVNKTTTVNKEEFKSRHSEVFSLGRHPRDFFVQRFGANHVRVISNELFVFVDGCWVAVDADGFVFAERVICAGDPDFIEVE